MSFFVFRVISPQLFILSLDLLEFLLSHLSLLHIVL